MNTVLKVPFCAHCQEEIFYIHKNPHTGQFKSVEEVVQITGLERSVVAAILKKFRSLLDG